MTDRSVLIIGAGFAGLAAGCYAQMNGYSTRIFEHHRLPGGVAASWKRNGYTIDGGVHYWLGLSPNGKSALIYDQLGITAAVNPVPMDVYCRFTEERGGNPVTIWTDLDRTERELIETFPSDREFLEKLFKGARVFSDPDLLTSGFKRPHELMGYRDYLKLLWESRGALPYLFGRHARSMRDLSGELTHDRLAFVLNNLFLPDSPAWFVMMILGILGGNNGSLIDGPSHEVPAALERRYRELGGRIRYGSTVKTILVENDRAVGVALEDGSEYRADVVVSAADGKSTIFNMLEGKYVDRSVQRRYSQWPLIPPVVMVSFGVSKELSREPWLSCIRTIEPVRAGSVDNEALSVRVFNYGKKFAEPGKTVVQAMLTTDWNSWYRLTDDPDRYDAEKQRVASHVLDRLDGIFGGLSSAVEITDTATPLTIRRYTLNHQGAYMGWLPTDRVLKSRIDKTLPGLSNFYTASQWAMPGGGVLPALYSGRQVVQLMCRKDRKPFRTSML